MVGEVVQPLIGTLINVSLAEAAGVPRSSHIELGAVPSGLVASKASLTGPESEHRNPMFVSLLGEPSPGLAANVVSLTLAQGGPLINVRLPPVLVGETPRLLTRDFLEMGGDRRENLIGLIRLGWSRWS